MAESSYGFENVPEEQLRAFETDVLEVLYRAYPSASYLYYAVTPRPPPEVKALQERYPGISVHIPSVVRGLAEQGIVATMDGSSVSAAQVGTGFVITGDGILELYRRRGLATTTNIEEVGRIAAEALAKIADVHSSVQDEQAKLRTSVSNVERDFYSRIFPFFAAFVAAFALILTGAQGVVRLSTTDPLQMALQSTAMMGPVALLVAALVWWTWLLSRRS